MPLLLYGSRMTLVMPVEPATGSPQVGHVLALVLVLAGHHHLLVRGEDAGSHEVLATPDTASRSC